MGRSYNVVLFFFEVCAVETACRLLHTLCVQKCDHIKPIPAVAVRSLSRGSAPPTEFVKGRRRKKERGKEEGKKKREMECDGK